MITKVIESLRISRWLFLMLFGASSVGQAFALRPNGKATAPPAGVEPQQGEMRLK